jgi:hypothetical protein
LSDISEDKLKPIFEQLINDIRSDVLYINNLFSVLNGKIVNSLPDEDIAKWIMDVFIDKIYELEVKMTQIFDDIIKRPPVNTKSVVGSLIHRAHQLAFPSRKDNIKNSTDLVAIEMSNLNRWVEWDLSDLRRSLIQSNWKEVSHVKPTKYLNLERKKYISAKEELMKAKRLIKTDPEDVMMHLRNAIDLSIKERFGFKKISFMGRFIEDAKKYDFALPSYDYIYQFFQEGSERMQRENSYSLRGAYGYYDS